MNYPRTILVIRFSSIGDVVQTTSVLGTLKKNFPDCLIDFMTLSKYSSLLNKHPHINNIYNVDIKANYTDLKSIAYEMNALKYDLVLDLHNTTRSKIIRKFINNSEKRYIRKPRWKRFKNYVFHLNQFPKNFSVRSWMNGLIADLIKEKNNPSNTKLFISKNEKIKSKAYIHSKGVINPFFVILPGAAWPQKTWLFERYVTVIKKCIEKYNLTPLLVGASSDIICAKINDSFEKNIIDIHGETNLRESIAIISQSEFVIGSDTGLIHAAEGLDIPAISILGPTTKETGAGVFNKKSVTVEDTNLWCRPCSQNGSIPCYRKKQYCMTNINVENVMSAVERVMQ